MQSISFDDYELSSKSAFNYVTRKMIKMVEQESKKVKNLSGYRWAIGASVAKSIFPERPTKIFDYDVVYEDPVIFYSNGINFEPGVVNTKNCSNCRFGCDGSLCSYIGKCFSTTLNPTPTRWKDMTAAQKIEKEMSNTKTNKKLVGNISSGYSYIDTDIAYNMEDHPLRYKDVIKTLTKYNKMFKKEDKKMDIKLYECGSLVGGVVTKPQDLIKNVIFSGPCTIVQWSDGDKTIVRCENEDFDKEKGLAMAIVKKFFGTNESKSNYNDIFKKWIPEEEVKEQLLQKEDDVTEILTAKQLAEKTGSSVSTILRDCRRGLHPGAMKVDGKWLIPFSGLKKEE